MAKFDFLNRLKLPHSSPAISNAERKAMIEAEERAALIAEGKILPEVEVIGQGSSRASPKTINIEEADTLSPMLNNVDLPVNANQDKMNKLKAMAATLGIGTGATLAVNAYDPLDNINPQAASAPMPIPPQAPAAPQIEPPAQLTETDKLNQELVNRLSVPSPAEYVAPMSKDIDFGDSTMANIKGLEEAQRASDISSLINRLGKAADIAGSGMSGTKPMYGDIFDANIKAGEKYVTDYQDQVKFEKEDPNSAISKGYKDIAKSMGFNIKGKASAADLERLMPQLANIYNQKQAQIARAAATRENRESRREVAQMMVAAKKDKDKEANELKFEDKKNRFIENAQKVTAKQFEKLQKVENAFDSIEQAQDDQMGAADVSILYNFIKSQDPESVVREGEIALGQRGMSLGGRLRTMTLGQFNGELLDPKFRKNVLKISRRLRDQGYNSYDQSVQNIRDTAQKRYGMSEDELTLIDPDLNRKKKKKEVEEKVSMNAPVPASVPFVSQSGLTPEQRRARIQELQAKKGGN
jgi:hypothetical protein